MGSVIGVDVGGTNIKAGLVSTKGRIIDDFETFTPKGSKNIIQSIVFAISRVKKGKILGIGIGSPGPMDYKKGIITNPVNLPFRNLPLRRIIRNKFRIKTYLDNDANCFTLAEATFGQCKKHENVIGITLGTGIGGGFVADKKIYHGRNNAAEFGHTTIKFDGLRARSGNQGDVEEYVSARGITKIFANNKNPHEIFKLAEKGNRKARKAFDKMGSYLGIGIVNILYAFDPDVVVIGGKISNSWKFFSKSMNNEIKKRYFAKPCPVIKSKLKDAGILGAAGLVLESQ